MFLQKSTEELEKYKSEEQNSDKEQSLKKMEDYIEKLKKTSE